MKNRQKLSILTVLFGVVLLGLSVYFDSLWCFIIGVFFLVASFELATYKSKIITYSTNPKRS